MAFDPAILGLPVELSQIPAQLRALWEGDTRTRASLLNFVVYCQDTSGFEANTTLISRFVRSHACRALLVGDCPSAHGNKISAWVQAHCHITKAGAQEVCSEQVTILAEGISQDGVANAILANLDYDLPLNLWWQGEFPKDATSPLWPRVDRLIFDSLLWENPAEALARLSTIRSAYPDLNIADLNWTRSLALRQALAECFETPSLKAELPLLNRVEIQHAPGKRTSAALLLSWLMAQLGWKLEARSDDGFELSSTSGAKIHCHLVSTVGEVLHGVVLSSNNATVRVSRDSGTPLLSAVCEDKTGVHSAHYPAGSTDLQSLITEELTPGSKHRVYLKALTAFATLVH